MAKKIVVFLIMVMAALTIDLLRQEVFAWMAPYGDRGATYQYSTSKTGSPGMKSVTPLNSLAVPYPPPDRPGRILYLPLVSNPAGQ
ncbi:MAG: hypothetical protein HY892_19475 [Deltaproteobacteria bacterium]|nr:hypothetical protein [Deltaproteobacteria bacterium]